MISSDLQEYQHAVGEFLVTFTSLESLVNAVVEMLLIRLGKKHLNSGKDYAIKVDLLELAGLPFHPMHSANFDRLRNLGKFRNDIAHGNYLIDPKTLEAWIVKAKDVRKERGKKIIPKAIRARTAEVRAALKDVETYIPYLVFTHPAAETEMSSGRPLGVDVMLIALPAGGDS